MKSAEDWSKEAPRYMVDGPIEIFIRAIQTDALKAAAEKCEVTYLYPLFPKSKALADHVKACILTLIPKG